MAEMKTDALPLCLPVLPTRGVVVFPQNIVNLDVGREKSTRAIEHAMKHDRKIFIVTQRDIQVSDPTFQDLYTVGVVAEIQQVIRSRNSQVRIMVEALYRAVITDPLTGDPFFTAAVQEYPVRGSHGAITDKMDAAMRTVKDLFAEYCEISPKMTEGMATNAMLTDDPVYLVDYTAGNMILPHDKKQNLLNENTVYKALQTLAGYLEGEINVLKLEKELYAKVKEQIDQSQREYYLREQQRAIAEELGETDNIDEEADGYQKKIDALQLNDEVRDKLSSEVKKLRKLHPSSQEAGVIRGYLDTVLELPWNVYTKDKIDIKAAARLLDREHYGLQKVKERILELLAVRQLAPDITGQIICLVGPPGVGKTSIAHSIAEAMGRKYVRMSLGGVRDESDIRGHRKTYIGSMPGRIMAAMKQAGSSNPLMLLDEVDKLGSDYRGDPSAALLEVLDSEQNVAFRDHYIEVPYDLSKVLFVATANTTDTIPQPLLDRMEVIELSSYTREEKFQIAKRHLVRKQMEKHGLDQSKLKISDGAIYAILDFYTREAGVRNLERKIGEICRKAARQLVSGEEEMVRVTERTIEKFLGPKRIKPDEISGRDEVGVVNGLAWTQVGGEMLQVEVAVLEGNGKIQLTGSLGDVMKESAQAAISYVRSVADRYGIEYDFYKTKDIHIHVPEGAVPKDGPSAGVTMTTAIVSALTGIPVKGKVAMTGEVTLRGRVLPIGGLREKTMAAYRNHITTVIIPKQNLSDLSEIDETVRKAIRFIPAETVSTVLENALCSLPHPRVAVPAALTHEEADPKGEVKNFELTVPKSEPVERPLVRR